MTFWKRPRDLVWVNLWHLYFQCAIHSIPIILIFNMIDFRKKKCFDLLAPPPRSRGCVFWNNTCYHVAACVSPFYLICSLTIFNKLIFDPLPLPKGVGVYVRTECLFSRCSTFHLIRYETWLISRWKCSGFFTPFLSGQGCLWVLNNCYHVSVFVVSFNFICSMTIFWKEFHFGLALSPKSTQGIGPRYPI